MTERRRGGIHSRFFDLPQGRLHARVAGGVVAGPRPPARDIVLVHGLGVSSRYFVPSLRSLGRHARVFAPDLPGYGRSRKPRDAYPLPLLAIELRGFLRSAGIIRPILLGNSFGCQIVVEFASRYPQEAEALVLVGPTMDARARTLRAQFGRWVVNAFREPPSIIPPLVADYMDCGIRRTWQTLRIALNDALEEKLPDVEVPTLVVRGRRDVIVPQRWAEEVTALIPGARLEVVERGAHVVNWDSPTELAEVVVRFLRDDLGCGQKV